MTENRATWSGLLRRPDSDIGEVQHVVVCGGEDEARKAFAENWPEYEVVRVQRMRLGSRPLIKPDPTSPEIDELIEGSWRGRSGQRDAVHLSDAIQAVRDTEARISAEVITDPFAGREDEIRREAAREIVEALRERASVMKYAPDRDGYRRAADHIARTFLTPEATDAR